MNTLDLLKWVGYVLIKRIKSCVVSGESIGWNRLVAKITASLTCESTEVRCLHLNSEFFHFAHILYIQSISASPYLFLLRATSDRGNFQLNWYGTLKLFETNKYLYFNDSIAKSSNVISTFAGNGAGKKHISYYCDYNCSDAISAVAVYNDTFHLYSAAFWQFR